MFGSPKGTSVTFPYLCRDYLGSITHIVNSAGSSVQELSYDAWGRLRNPINQTLYSVGSEPVLFLGRGYIGHEHLTMFGLVNMNARLYDPVVARFLSPDPYVQIPFDSQNFNRYSYCMNNPLVYMDQSGEFFLIDDIVLGIIGGIINLGVNIIQGNIHGNVWQIIGQSAAAFGAGAVAGMIVEYGPEAWAAGGALVGATNAWLGGATGTDILVAGVAGGVSGLAGGAAGALGSRAGGMIVNSFKINGPAFTGAIKGAIGGFAGGAAGGFAGAFVMTGDINTALQASKDGMISGGAMGAIAGAGSGLKYAHKNKLNPWTGEKRDLHHSYPKFLGGDPNQELTPVSKGRHKTLHKEMYEYLIQQNDGQGHTMRPTKGNPGRKIQMNFSPDSRLNAAKSFYNMNKYKYFDVRYDFYKNNNLKWRPW